MHVDITYWRDDFLKGFETCQVYDSRYSFPKHVHDTVYAVGLMEKGASYSLGPGRDDGLVGAGQIALINPGQVHSGVPVLGRAVTYRMLYFDIDLMRSTAEELNAGQGVLPEFTSVVVNDTILRLKLIRLCRIMAGRSEGLERQSLLVDAMAHLLSGYAGVRKPREASVEHPCAVRQAKAFMAADLDQKITLDDLARCVGLSRYHLIRIFKQHTGLPPHLYRTQRRIDLAKTLLRQGMPFAQVALETGFTDQSHFTNKFKQFTAATPSQYIDANTA
jgi:AraC-like DNA-binding protein